MIVGIIAIAVLLATRSRRLRPPNSTQCPNCKSRMIHLDDTARLTQLDAGQQREQDIQSVNYDIWQCQACAMNTVEKCFPSSPYITCPACHYQTLLVQQNVKRQPTRSSAGFGEMMSDCVSCDYHRTESVVLPMLIVNQNSEIDRQKPDDETGNDRSQGYEFSSGADRDDDRSGSSGGSSSGSGASASW